MRSGGSFSRIKGLLICGLILCIAINGLNAASCKLGCTHSDSGVLKYVPGSVYTYNIESLVTIGVSGNDADETAVKLSGQARLYAEGNCKYTLQLDRFTVSSAKESIEKQITQSLSKPIKFTLGSGVLEPEICADPNDSSASLNIKRGIISLLQASENPQETDVFGVCPTVTSVSKAGTAEIMTKVRNLNACSYREKTSNGLVVGVVDNNAGTKSSAVLNADYSKEMKLVRGIPENVQLVEEYKFAALANGAGGAKVKVKTTLKLGNVGKGNAPNGQGEPSSIIFEQPSPPPVKNIAALRKVFTNTVNLVSEHVQGDAAQHFTELIRLMRQSDAETLIEASSIPGANKVLSRKVFLDALFRVGTSNSVKAIVRLASKMSEQEKKLAFLSMNWVENVERDALNQAASLLNPNSPKEAFLAIGNLVNKYCKLGTCDQNEVNVVSKKFADSLKHCKANTKKDEDRFVNILKGIRNAHKIADASTNVLAECASVDRSIRLRVAAIQSFSAAPCDSGLKAKALSILKDHNEDSELRIEAYLALVACPSAQLGNEIADIVNNEPVNQVGGFITSHLKAIRDSTDASREAMRHYLGNVRVTKKFPIDPRRYSFNHEVSYLIESLGVGASADTNVIYSQKGFLPRSARLNVTTEVFGSNYNLVEIQARQENLEEVLDYYFGPKGHLSSEGQHALEILSNKQKSKRSIADDTEKFSKKYKTYGSKSNEDINLDLALRIFGSEMFFLSLSDEVPQTVDDILRKFTETLGSVKNKLKNFEHEYSCHSLFLDTQLVYATGAGLPLELAVQGTSASKLTVATEIDIDAIMENPHNRKYGVKLVPSMDISVNGHLRVDAFALVAGIRASSVLHSSTGNDFRFELTNDGNGFNIDVAFPRQNHELLDFKHNVEFVIAEQDRESRIVPLKSKKKKSVPQENCFDQLHYIGMTVCFTSVFPDTTGSDVSSFPLSGPVHVAIRLQTEKKINLQGTFEKNAELREYKLKYSTPGSQIPHDAELKFQLGNQPKMFARLSLEHPQIRLSTESGLSNTEKEFTVYEKYDVNGEVTLIKIGLNKNGDEYTPLIEMKTSKGVTNEINGYRAEGRIIKQNNGNNVRFVYDNLQVISKTDRVTLNGFADSKPFKSEIRIQHGKDTYDIKAHLNLENGYSVGLFVRDQNSPHSNGGSLDLQLSSNSIKDTLILALFDYHLEMNNELDFNRDENNNVKDSRFKNELKLKKGNALLLQGRVNGETNEKLVQLLLEADRESKKASLDFNLLRDQRSPGDLSLSVKAKLNKHFIDLNCKTDVKGAHYVLDNHLSTSWGTQLTVKGEVSQRLTSQDTYIDLEGNFLINSKSKRGKYLLKVLSTLDKTSSDFKLIHDNAELILYNSEITHPQDKIAAGKLNLQIKDLIVAKADLKTSKGGKGDLTGSIHLKKSQRSITINSKFIISAPKYDIEATVGYDNDKKLVLKTESIIDKKKISTKNLLDINGEKVQFDANGSIKGDPQSNGEIEGKFTLTVPNGREFDGQLSRKFHNSKTGLGQGTMSLVLGDKLASNERRTIELSGNIDKLNIKKKEFNSAQKLVYTNFAGKTIELAQKLKHLPKGHYKTLDYSLELRGESVGAPLEASLVIDEYDAKHATFRISGKYGDQVSGNLNGNYDLGDRAVPANYALQGHIAAPQSNFKTYSLTTTGKYLRPETEDGVRSFELHFDQQASEHSIKLNTIGRGSHTHGTYNFDLSSTLIPHPLKFEGSYNRETQQDESAGKYKYNMNYSYGDKSIQTALDLSYVESKSVILHYVVDSTLGSTKTNVDLTIRSSNANDDTLHFNSDFKLNEARYMLDSTLYNNEHKKGVVLKATLPQKETSFTGIVETLGEHKGKLTLKIENLLDLDLAHTLEANFNSFEDFYVTSQTNSEKLKIKDLNLNIHTQAGTGGKGVEFVLNNANGVIISGTAQYTIKKEKGKTVVEGEGQFQYYEKTNNFKIIHQTYDVATDQEVGFSFTFNGTFGPKNAVSTFKMTNKNFQAKLSVCEEKKQCTNVEIRSIITVDPNDVTSLDHDLMILIDLRELGYPHEFELQSKRSQKGFKYSHEIESNIISNSNTKYQLVASMLPHLNKIQIKLPRREIYIETEQVVPKNILGHYKNSITFYFDRQNKPNDVTKLIASADLTGVEKVAINADGKVRFEHPTIRPLSISGHFDANYDQQVINSEVIFDVFKTPEQKIIARTLVKNSINNEGHGFNITSENQIRSSGLGIQYEANGHSALLVDKQEFSLGFDVHSGLADIKSSGLLYGSKDRIEIVLNGMNEQILNVLAKINENKQSSKFDANLKLFAMKPLKLSAELDKSNAKISLKRDGLLEANAEIKLGKEAKIEVRDQSKSLLHGRIALSSDEFLVTSFESKEEDIKMFLKSAEAVIADERKATKDLMQRKFQKIREAIDRQSDLIKESAPDFSAMQMNLKDNVNAVLKELESDEAIKALIEDYHKLYNAAMKLYEDVSHTVVESYKTIHASAKELITKVQAILKESILPILEDFAKKMNVLLGELQLEAVKLLTSLCEQTLKSLKSLETDLKALGKPLYDALKPITENLLELLQTLAKDFAEVVKDLEEYVSKLPTFDSIGEKLKKKLAEWKTADEILRFLQILIDQLNSLSASNESNEFTKKLYDYIEAKLHGNPVNDIETLEDIYESLLRAINSLLKRLSDLKPPGTNFLAPIPLSLELLRNIPTFISIRFSLLNFILNEKINGLAYLAELSKPPFDFLPPLDLIGHIVDGKNLFTFDGRQYSFQGSCKYILSQDANRNSFSVVGNLKDGKLKSLTLVDSSNFLEVSDSGALKLNGKPTEFPVHVGDIHAWRDFNTLRLLTKFGAEVICTSDLKVCHIKVDGFYTSKTRGLLGNGNAEQFDDLTNVEGKIVDNYPEFVNNYGLGNCPAVNVGNPESVQHDQLCTELFSLDSELVLGYLFIDHRPYRQACDEAVLASPDNKEEAACNIALAYASANILEKIPVSLPDRCLKCSGPPGQRELNEQMSFKIPTNKADVVLIVDIGSSKNIIDNLVTPVVSDLRNQLKTRGLTDTKIIVVAYSQDQLYPALLTSDGGKLNYNGKLSNLVLNGPQRSAPIDIKVPILGDILKFLESLLKKFTTQSDEDAFDLAIQYPFRAGAAKAILAVRSDRLDYNNLFKVLRAHITAGLTKFGGASIHVIAPIKDLSVEGVPPEKLVGFNSRTVATTENKDAKKRQKLKFASDMGTDFVLQNNGWVFSSQNFEAIKTDDQRRGYVNQVTSSIADTLFKTEIVSECECVQEDLLYAEHKCSIKSSNFVQNKRVKGKK